MSSTCFLLSLSLSSLKILACDLFPLLLKVLGVERNSQLLLLYMPLEFMEGKVEAGISNLAFKSATVSRHYRTDLILLLTLKHLFPSRPYYAKWQALLLQQISLLAVYHAGCEQGRLQAVAIQFFDWSCQ